MKINIKAVRALLLVISIFFQSNSLFAMEYKSCGQLLDHIDSIIAEHKNILELLYQSKYDIKNDAYRSPEEEKKFLKQNNMLLLVENLLDQVENIKPCLTELELEVEIENRPLNMALKRKIHHIKNVIDPALRTLIKTQRIRFAEDVI